MSPNLKPNILVVDANIKQLGQTADALAPAKFQVVTAVCRESAISAARTVALDLLLVDLALASHGSGCSLVEEIHGLPDRGEVPVIFTSPGQGPDVIRRQHDFGGAYHVKTPFDSTVMITLIERALWMPHLIQSHVARPHFQLGLPTPAMGAWNGAKSTTAIGSGGLN